MLEPFHYLTHVPGKDVRGKLIDAFQQWLCISDDKLAAVKDIVAQLHTASLLYVLIVDSASC